MQEFDRTQFSFYTNQFVVWLITLNVRSPRERDRYRAIISGLLPEVLTQRQSNQDTMNFVLERWRYAPDNEVKIISSLLNRGIRLAENLGWIALGSVSLLILVGMLAVNLGKNSPVTISQTSPSPSAQLTPNSPTTPAITQQEAINIVYVWLQAKQRIFSPPFDRQLVADLTTGERYAKTIEAIEELQKNNAYYKFAQPKIEATGEFYSPDKNQILIGLRITEDYTYYVNDQLDPSGSRVDTQVYSLLIKLEDGHWKIAKTIR